MASRLVLLGTGTCVLDSARQASAVLVELPSTRFVFDFGRGIAVRLSQLGIRQDQLRHVILSHFHPDHFSDLLPYLHAGLYSPSDPRRENLHIYGPDGLQEVVSDLARLAGLQELAGEAPFRLELHRLGERITIDGISISCRHLPPAGNHGIRFQHGGRAVVLTGDSEFHQQEVDFVRGAQLAVIDAGHLNDQEIVELAATGRPATLVCSHLYRELDEERLRRHARERGFHGTLVVGEDLMEFPL